MDIHSIKQQYASIITKFGNAAGFNVGVPLNEAVRKAIGDNNPMMLYAVRHFRNDTNLVCIMAEYADVFIEAVTAAAAWPRRAMLERYLTTAPAPAAATTIVDANPDYTVLSFRFVGLNVTYVYGYKDDNWVRVLQYAVTDINRGVLVPYSNAVVVKALRQLGAVTIQFGDADDAGARALWAAIADIEPNDSGYSNDNWKTNVNLDDVVKDIRCHGL